MHVRKQNGKGRTEALTLARTLGAARVRPGVSKGAGKALSRGGLPRRRTVLLTGASTGLGWAIATELLRGPHRLVLTARASSLHRFSDLGVQPSARVWLRPLDVTDDAQRCALVEEIDARLGGVDVLINNAGVSYRAVVEHVAEAERLAQMDINFRSPMELSRLVMPAMRARGGGHVISISSVGGMMAMPTMGVYSASKFALEGAMEALWYEVRPWNVRVSLVQPGFIRSSSFNRVKYTKLSAESERDGHEPYHAHYRHMSPFIARMMRMSWASPEQVAQVVIRTMNRRYPPLRVPATFDARVFSAMRRFLPRALYHWLLYQNLPGIARWGQGPRLSLPAPRESGTRIAAGASGARLSSGASEPGCAAVHHAPSWASEPAATAQSAKSKKL